MKENLFTGYKSEKCSTNDDDDGDPVARSYYSLPPARILRTW